MANTQPLPRVHPAFHYDPPDRPAIGILSIPHSGEAIPDAFRSFLTADARALGQDVDTAVDQLVDIQALNAAGVAVLRARVHRVCVDLNRSSDEAILNWPENTLGTRLVTDTPDDAHRARLIDQYFSPYYQMIASLVTQLQEASKSASFIDLHSMPSTPTAYHLQKNPHQESDRPDFCLSDLDGQSCSKAFIDFITRELAQSFGRVYQNNPYRGGHLTRHVHAAFDGVNGIQIEVKRGLYLFEERREPDPVKVANLRSVLTRALIRTFQRFREQP